MTQEIDAAVGHIVAVLGREQEAAGFSPGDRAELRRMDPLGPALPPALWRLLTAGAVAEGVKALGGDRERAERAVAILVQAMLEAGGSGEARPIGKVLGETGYAEQRFVRLLRARDLPDVAAEARYAVRWCAGKGVRVRFGDGGGPPGFARFILAAVLGWNEANSRAHAMARDYFASNQPDAET